MANSLIVTQVKNAVVKDMLNDEEIIKALDAEEITDVEDLYGTHIFDYNYNKNTLQTSGTFITIQVNLPQPYRWEASSIMIKAKLEIWIVSHVDHMKLKNIPKVKGNRNDYLSQLIDAKYNGTERFGVGECELISNEEMIYQPDYVYRRLIFGIPNVNKSLC